MIRAEIIANQSVKEELVTALGLVLPEFLYTIIPAVYGRGKNSCKLGTSIWPEANFILVAYCDSSCEGAVRAAVRYVKGKFKNEGIKLFVLHDRESGEEKRSDFAAAKGI